MPGLKAKRWFSTSRVSGTGCHQAVVVELGCGGIGGQERDVRERLGVGESSECPGEEGDTGAVIGEPEQLDRRTVPEGRAGWASSSNTLTANCVTGCVER